MPAKKKKIIVRKTTPEQEQQSKDEAFLNLSPAERLKIHEGLRKRIWGKAYNAISLKGLKVSKKPVR
jgi:hypothetical protein